MVDDSILNTTKKLLNIPADYDAFDLDVIIHINSVFATLHQLGVGPVGSFSIENDGPKWSDFLPSNNPELVSVKSYMAAKVRMMFDPPTTSFAIDALGKIISEFEWRLNVGSETP